ncbi:MAG: [protein-PII] uridylyltransferase, partial [Actinomycetes bacterium]
LTVLRAIGASWLVDARLRSLEGPTIDLLDARDALHLATGRVGDRLTLQEQGPASRILGDPNPDTFLRRVSAAGRAIAYVSDEAWHRVDRLISERRRIPVRFTRSSASARAPLTEGVVVQDGDVVLAADARPDRDPVLVLRAAAAAAQAGLRLSPYAVERLANESAPMPVPWPATARDALVSLLGAGKPAIAVWEALEQQNVITALIPQWGFVRSAPQRNPVHRFTVDRHLVETAVNASDRMRSVARPDLLLVGALLHDIGKGQGGDHTEIGVRIVTELGPRLGFDARDSEVLVSMVRNHLLLPDTATRRDLTDPATALMVADAVKTGEVLDLLGALSWADAAATGPAAWSTWKSELISDLVRRVHAVLAGESAPLPPVLTPAQLAVADAPAVAVLVEEGAGAWQVTVGADDRLGLLATVAGVLALHRLAVRSARTETVGARAVTVWNVEPEFGEPPGVDTLRQDIRLALAGTLDVTAKLAQRAAAQRRPGSIGRPPPRVDAIGAASQRATVVEVRAHDAPGLLHVIATAISSADVVIDAAKVETLGSEVVDVFYLLADGRRLDDEQIAAVRDAVLQGLTGIGGQVEP